MAVTYCNITSDLVDAFHKIDDYNRKERVDSSSWESVSGTINRLEGTGYVEMVYDDGQEMTAGSNATPGSGEFWYDSDADILYVNTGGTITASIIHLGINWDVRKTRARNDAQELLEGFLKSAYPTPFQKVITPGESYNSRNYDYWIRKATALLTCSMLIKSVSPEDPMAQRLYRMVDFSNPEAGEDLGLVQRMLNGEIVLRTQRSAREIGGYNVFEGSSNGATAYFELSGRYSGTNEEIWKVIIDGPGAPGTATYKISYDNGATFESETQETLPSGSDNVRVHLGRDIYCRFVGAFAVDDEITIHLIPHTDTPLVQSVGNIKLNRG